MQIRLVFTDNLNSYKNTQPITILKNFTSIRKINGMEQQEGLWLVDELNCKNYQDVTYWRKLRKK